MTVLNDIASPTASTQKPTVNAVLRVIKHVASLVTLARPAAHHTFNHDHHPRHVKLANALDELERARLLQGGLR